MSYYMNGLLISQLLWHHHFNTYVHFKQNLNRLFKSDQKVRILDVGPGHGFYSFIVKNNLPNYQCIDLIDISESSLEITKKMIGHEDFTIHYFNQDVLKFDPTQKYDLIILGEVIEHLDDPHEILLKLSKLLTPHGILWVTAPTNAPAIDHVFLFKNKAEILDLIEDSDLKIINEIGFYSDKVTDEVALKNKVTHLICAFCKRK